MNNIFTSLIEAAPIIQAVFPSDCMIGIANKEKIIYNLPGVKIKTKPQVGLKLTKGDGLWEAVNFKQVFNNTIPKEIWGIPYKAICAPLINEQGNVVGAFGWAISLENQEILHDAAETIAASLKQISARTHERNNNKLQKLRVQQMKVEDVVAKSREICTIFENAFRIAQVDTTVLILGESGVGKEVVAKMIHYSGPRSQQGSFIKINCGAIPRDLLESELFGYEPGSFTGSGTKTKLGLFELADKGTLFLDEIGDLPADLQVKILRVLQEHEFRRIGGNETIQVNVRIIAATNRDLETMIAQGKFREDLYYRLNVIPICIPPLRERPEDIPALLISFTEKFNLKYNSKKTFSPRAFNVLVNYSWPGNVRQLANLVERLVVTCVEDIIDIHQLPEQVHSKEKVTVMLKLKEIVPLKEAVREVEKQLINLALNKYENTYEAAKALGISQPTMSRKANKYSN